MSTKNWPKNQLIVCLFIQGWLIFFHFLLSYHETPSVRILGQAFDFTRESTLPTFFSSLLAFSISITSFAVYFVVKKGGTTRIQRGAWLLAGFIFLFIAVDDSMGFHERLGSITSTSLLKTLHYSSYPWHVTVAPVIAISLLSITFIIWRKIGAIEGLRPMLLLALGCFATGFGIDHFEGTRLMDLLATQSSGSTEFLPILMVIEEVMEMAGTIIFFFVVFSYLCHLVPEVRFSLREIPVSEKAPEASPAEEKDPSTEGAVLSA